LWPRSPSEAGTRRSGGERGGRRPPSCSHARRARRGATRWWWRGGDRRVVVAALAERGGDATRPWREARSATAPTVSASFSECRPSGTHAVGDRVYSYAAQRAPCGESRCQPGRGQIRLFPEPARVGRRGRAPAMTARHRELPVRTEVARVAEGSGVGDRLAGHVASEAILNGRRRFFPSGKQNLC